MYQKVRIHLTILFSAVTCTLLLVFLCVSLYISERSQFSLVLSGFSKQSSAVLEDIHMQSVLTIDWLSAREDAGSFYLFLLDQGIPIFHDSTHPAQVQELFDELLPCFPANAPLSPSSGLRKLSEEPAVYAVYTEHSVMGKKKFRGFFPTALLYYEQTWEKNSLLQIFSLCSLDALYHDVRKHIASYSLLFILGGCFLVCFSRYFTGRLLKPLLDSQESQNRFIASASHELRTPLAVILTSASACRDMSPKEQAAFFDIIEREGAQMSDMLEQLLLLSRADSHGLHLKIEETDLQTLLLDTYEAFLPLARREGHFLSIRLPDVEIPLCLCDGFRVKQVCTILLENALAYTPEGSLILLSLSCLEKGIQISVQDNGPGVPDEEKEAIFQRFSRGKYEDNKKGHHGLGLAVAKEIASAHSGTIQVQDVPEGGAVFVFCFPIHP